MNIWLVIALVKHHGYVRQHFIKSSPRSGIPYSPEKLITDTICNVLHSEERLLCNKLY
jgi:hypothetical protein